MTSEYIEICYLGIENNSPTIRKEYACQMASDGSEQQLYHFWSDLALNMETIRV